MSATGGGITVCGTVGSTFYVADLPYVSTWGVKMARPMSEAVSLAGTVIRQAAAKSYTAGVATFSGWVAEAEAEKIRTLDEGASQVYVGDGDSVYLAIMDASVGLAVRGGKRQVAATFSIVRAIVGRAA